MAKRALGLMLATAASAVAAVGTMNLVVDPYAYFGHWGLPGINQVKPAALTQSRAFKVFQYEAVRPTTVLIGNSRVDIGLDPQSSAWEPRDQPVYNLAQPGGTLYTTLRYLQHAMAVHPPRRVVMALDFLDFRAGLPDTPSPDVERRLTVNAAGWPNDQAWRQRLWDHVAATLSLEALGSSLWTLWQQNDGDAGTVTPLGFNPARQYPEAVRSEGHVRLFRANTRQYFDRYGSAPKTIYEPGTHDSQPLHHFRAIIDLCRTEGIQLILYVHPYHADILELFWRMGLGEAFEEWKRLLASLAAENPEITLWDFSGFHAVATEPVPETRGVPMRWYWEPGHYKKELGEVLLEAMLRGRDAGFGIRLAPDNVEAALDQDRQRRLAWLTRDPPPLARLPVSPEGLAGHAVSRNGTATGTLAKSP